MKKNLKCIVLSCSPFNSDLKFATDGEIIYFDFDKNTTVEELKIFLNKKSSINKFGYFDLLDKEKISIIALYGQRIGKIDWNLDYSKVKISDFNNGENIIIKTFSGGGAGGIGDYVDLGLILNILEYVYKIITFFIKRFITLEKAYQYLCQEAYMEKSFVTNVILQYEKWNIGFISNKDFNKKQIIENKIMKSLGYKKIKSEKCWSRK